MTNLPLTKAVKLVSTRVSSFSGDKRYLATGGLVGRKVSYEAINFNDKPSRADLLVASNQIIVARMKDTNKVLLIDNDNSDIVVSTGFMVFEAQKGWHPRFLYHFMKSEVFQSQKNRYCTGATQKAITNSSIAKINIPELSYESQVQLANKLDGCEQLIIKREQSIAETDNYLKAKYLEMFGKSDDIENVRLFELSKESKGSIRTGPFGSDLKHSEFVDEGIAVIGIDNAVKNRFEWNKRRYITEQKYEKLKRYTVHPRDVIVTIMGTTGRSAVIPEDIPVAINTKHLVAMSFNPSMANPYFISFALQFDPSLKMQMTKQTKGAIMNGLNSTIIKNLLLPKWPIEKQDIFESIYHSTMRTRDEMTNQLADIEKLFLSISYNATNG